MRVRLKIPFAMRKLALATALATVYSQAGATLVADGKLGDAAVGSAHGTAAAALMGEGYSTGWIVGFNDDAGNFIGNGQLWFGTDGGGNQFLYFLLPTDYVDNTYGTNASAGWKKGHTFSDLLGSDSMGASPNLSWNDKAGNYAGAGTNNAARIDYIANCSASTAAATNCKNGYRSAGVGGTGTGVTEFANGGGAKWTKMDSALTGSAASILEIATSLEYDLNTIDPTATTNSSLNTNWLKEVGYEIEFKPGTFDPAKWGKDVQLVSGQVSIPGLLTLGDPHVSPPKTTFGAYTTPCMIAGPGGGCGAPEPGTTWLLGAGLAGMAWYARRRRQGMVPVPGGALPS
jgi:hypothetical protein